MTVVDLDDYVAQRRERSTGFDAAMESARQRAQVREALAKNSGLRARGSGTGSSGNGNSSVRRFRP